MANAPPNSSPTPRHPSSDSRKGSRLVVALLAVGVAVGLMVVMYWSAQGRWMRSREAGSTHPEAAGSVVWDEDTAAAELGELQQRFNDVASENGQVGAISEAAQRLVERYPKYDAAHTLLGQVLVYQGRFDEAYERFKLSLSLNGQQPELQLLAGTLALKLDQIDKATGHYSMAVGLDTANPRYRTHLAQAYIKQHKYEEARAALLEALRIDSSLHGAYALLADLYAQQNRLVLALPQIQRAIEQTPVSERATRVIYTRRQAQLLRRNNQPDEALMALGALTPVEQADPQVMGEIALCWSLQGQPEEAAAMYERAISLNPTAWPLIAEAARWRIKAGDLEAAQRHLTVLRQVNPRAQAITDLEEQLSGP